MYIEKKNNNNKGKRSGKNLVNKIPGVGTLIELANPAGERVYNILFFSICVCESGGCSSKKNKQ